MESLSIEMHGALVGTGSRLLVNGTDIFGAAAAMFSGRKAQRGRVSIVIESGIAYKGIGPNEGIMIPLEDAEAYYLENFSKLPQWEKNELLGAFFSGNFMKVNREEIADGR